VSDLDALGFVSADGHVNEPRNLWRDNLPANLRARALRGITPGAEGNWELVLDGELLGEAVEDEAARVLISDPEHRYAIMREEGIVAECIYPTVALYVWMLPDADVGVASCRVYNEWIADGLARSPRFKCAGLVPTWRVDDAVSEVARIADTNLGSIMLPAVAAPEWNHRAWEPLWAAIEETGLPVVIHQGTGHSMYFYRGPGAGVSNLLATQSMGPRTAALLSTSGVLADHPGLRVVFAEFNGGWLGWTMQTLDFYTKSFAEYGTTSAGKKWVNPELPEPPSFYLRRQVSATFQDDPVALQNAAYTGAQSILWGSDYPHSEGTYPHSRDTVHRLALGMDTDVATKVFRANAAELFHFGDDVLAVSV
jgi:predicted TIM-barrel fold metal-dependent hydrolase